MSGLEQCALDMFPAEALPDHEAYEKIQDASRIWRDVWAPYPAGAGVVERLWWLIEKPKCFRPLSALIVGEPNVGKTMAVRRFILEVERKTPKVQGQTIAPVLYAITPPDGDVDGLYCAMLRAIGAPTPRAARAPRKRDQLLALLPQVGTRMIIIDEIHDALNAKKDKQDVFFSALKSLSNELQIPVVGIGTIEALRAVQTNAQLGSRFPQYRLNRWQHGDEELPRFLIRLSKLLGVDGSQALRKKKVCDTIMAMSEGLTGEIRKIMGLAADLVVKEGGTQFDPDVFDRVAWIRPSDRRKVALK